MRSMREIDSGVIFLSDIDRRCRTEVMRKELKVINSFARGINRRITE